MKQKLSKVDPWKAEGISNAIQEIQEELALASKVVLKILRYSVSGLAPGVGVAVTMEILGKQRVNERLEKSLPPHSGQ